MRIYIHTDLEGISGIGEIELMDRSHPNHRYAIERQAMDINAAIDGAFAGGATFVTVLDSHAGGGNFDEALIDKRADIDRRTNGKEWGKMEDGYDGTFFIGAHAMAGTLNAFIDHTQSSYEWLNYYVNGRRMGELGQWAMMAGQFDIPMIMVAGDEAAIAETREFFNPVECAVVKRGLNRNRAALVESDKAIRRIYEAAKKSISLVGKAKPFKPNLPIEIILELARTDYSDKFVEMDGVERIDARTVRKVSNDYLDNLIL